MSCIVASHCVSYAEPKLRGVPRGVVVLAGSEKKPWQESGGGRPGRFWGVSMAPQLSGAKEHISFAVSGVATARVYIGDGRTPHVGTPLYVDDEKGFEHAGRLTTKNPAPDKPHRDKPVAYYLQKNGPSTAQVWISRHTRTFAASGKLPTRELQAPTAGLPGRAGAAGADSAGAAPETQQPAKRRRMLEESRNAVLGVLGE